MRLKACKVPLEMFFVIISFSLLILSCIALYFVNSRLKNSLSFAHGQANYYELFLQEHFLNPMSDKEMQILDSLSLKDETSLLIYSPTGACSACVIDSMLTLEEAGFKDKTSLYFERESQMLINESKMRGFNRIHIVEIPGIDSMTSILVRKIDEHGLSYYLKLPSSNQEVLKLFLNYSIFDKRGH